jgi:hypothetical protein
VEAAASDEASASPPASETVPEAAASVSASSSASSQSTSAPRTGVEGSASGDDGPRTPEADAASLDDLVSAASDPAAPSAPAVTAAPRPAAPEAEPPPAVAVEAAIPSPRPSLTLTPTAQYWVRGQSRLNAKHDPAVGDRESAVLQRVRLGLRAETGPLRAYVEVQDNRTWGFETGTIANMANVDLHQGYLELGRDSEARGGFVRVGRQEIEIGSRRLFVDANWHPMGQSFDALRIAGHVGRFGADAGVIVLEPPATVTVDDPSGDPALAAQVRSRGTVSYYLQGKAELHPQLNLEGLVLGISERPSVATPTVERDIINAGVRLYGAPLRGLSYDVEAYGQAGRNLGLRHRAWAAFATVIYTFPQRLKPGLSLRYNYATGQGCTGAPEEGCGNDRSGEFYRFFGLRHARYGIADRVGYSNLRNLEVGAHLSPHEAVRLNLAYHFIQLDQATGRWINAGDKVIGAGWDPTNTSRDLGHEVDLTVTIRPWKELFLQPGYAAFVPLEAAQRIAGPATQHFVFLWMIGTF